MGGFNLYETKFVSGIGDHDPEQDAKQNMSETTNQQLYLGYINPGWGRQFLMGYFMIVLRVLKKDTRGFWPKTVLTETGTSNVGAWKSIRVLRTSIKVLRVVKVPGGDSNRFME